MKKKFLGMGMPSASMVVAVAALGVGLAGGASAAGDLITGADVKNGSITGVDIKNGSVRFQDLTPSTRARLLSADGPAVVAGPAGSAGAKGDTGANGIDGQNGIDGRDGVNGANGQDGVNPAVAIKASGDHGWAFTGSPNARLVGGELRLAGGFDGSTTAGGIGMTKLIGTWGNPAESQPADGPLLSSLSALSYSLNVTKRPNDNSAPTIHVAVIGAATGTASGFMQLVYEPYNNGGVEINKPYTLDAFTGQWWGTKDTPNHPRQATGSLASFVQDNPNAKIIADQHRQRRHVGLRNHPGGRLRRRGGQPRDRHRQGLHALRLRRVVPSNIEGHVGPGRTPGPICFCPKTRPAVERASCLWRYQGNVRDALLPPEALRFLTRLLARPPRPSRRRGRVRRLGPPARLFLGAQTPPSASPAPAPSRRKPRRSGAFTGAPERT